jgi:hypothetical protein
MPMNEQANDPKRSTPLSKSAGGRYFGVTQ